MCPRDMNRTSANKVFASYRSIEAPLEKPINLKLLIPKNKKTQQTSPLAMMLLLQFKLLFYYYKFFKSAPTYTSMMIRPTNTYSKAARSDLTK